MSQYPLLYIRNSGDGFIAMGTDPEAALSYASELHEKSVESDPDEVIQDRNQYPEQIEIFRLPSQSS